MLSRLLVLALLLAVPAAHAVLPTCAQLTVQAHTSRRTATPGSPVKLTVTVKNMGAAAAAGLDVRVDSAVVGSWQPRTVGKDATAATTDDQGRIYWLAQQVQPRKQRRYVLSGRVCAGTAAGAQTLATVTVYQRNGTGNVVCATTATPKTATIKSAKKPISTAPICPPVYPGLNNRVYVASYGSNSVDMCAIDDVTGVISACEPAATGFSGPFGITFTASGHALVTEFNAGTVALCGVAADGKLVNCGPSGATGLNSPRGIVVTNTSPQRAYIVSAGQVKLCVVDGTTGAIPASGCRDSGATNLQGAGAIAFTEKHAYIVNSDPSANPRVLKCDADAATGALGPCSSAGGTYYSDPSGIAISQGYAYMSSNRVSYAVTICRINSATGSFENCVDSGVKTNGPSAAAAIAGGLLYMSEIDTGAFLKCTVDLATGGLKECAPTGAGLNGPRGLYVFP